MEIEAKFMVSDQATYERLKVIDQLGDYQLSAAHTQLVSDQYKDTAERSLLAGGYACRYRQQGDQVIVAVKGLGQSEGAIHRREEWEVTLSIMAEPDAWPDSAARHRVLQLAVGQPLQVLFALKQKRIKREVHQNKRLTAEWSLDTVEVVLGERNEQYHELEIELVGNGTEDDLAALVHNLATNWSLKAETRSKFERALVLIDQTEQAE